MRHVLSCFALLLLVACGGDDPAPAPEGPSPWLLDASPGEALSVVDARKAEADSAVVVHGRVMDINPDGVAQFTLIDKSLLYCGEGTNTDDTCPIPWDYCCEDPDVVAASRLTVELRDADGNLVRTSNLGIRLLDHLAMAGTLTHTEAGSPLLVVTKGWHRLERPALGSHVQFP